MNQDDEELKQMFDLPAKTEPKEVVPVEAPKGNIELQADFEYTRDNMYTAMEMQNEAMQEMLELAKASGHQRAFEVFGSMFSQYTDAQTKLMNLHQQKEKIKNDEQKTVNNTTNVQQNVLVGSTKDLLKMVKSGQVKEDGEIVH
tara:strand:+ start:227 stop:658 length:432 start_codon:yes stop_codon:yes gene_type:complete